MDSASISITVLHVDDDPDVADLVATYLEREDERLHVETVQSASEALDRLAAERFDCVVSDYDMPEQNGIEFLKTVRQIHPELPFILYTGKGSEEVASEAISAGVTDYLQKERGTGQYAVLANRIANSVETYQTQTKLEDRDKRLSLFFEQSPIGVIEWDTAFDLVRMNEAAEEILGYSQTELQSESWETIVPDSDREDVDTVVSALLENSGGYHSINENVRSDGERILCEWHNRVVTDDDEVVAIFSQFQDITDRRKREHAIERLHDTTRELLLADSDERIAEIVVRAARDILDMPLNGVALADETDSALEMVAMTDRSEEIIGDPPTFRPGNSLAWEAFETGEPRHYDDVSTVSDRHNPDTEIRSEIIAPLGSHGVILIGATETGTFDEIDRSLAETLATQAEAALDRLAHEQELKHRSHRQKVLFENSPDLIDVHDAQGRIVDANHRFCAELGYEKDDVLGKPIWEIDQLYDEAAVSDLIAEFERDERRKFEGRYERADGSAFPVEVHLMQLDLDGERQFLAISRDITERKQYEQRLEQQNERLEKFASVVSHDLRNPLTVAKGRLELAREERDSEHLAKVATAHQRIEDLIEDLLSWTRDADRMDERDVVDLSTFVSNCWENVETADTSLNVTTTRTLMAQRSRFQQFVENLIRNAVEHGGDSVTITVGDLSDGFYIEDDGVGIPESERAAVLEAGYSTQDDGTGYGLSIVKEVVREHGWDLRVTEGRDGGARFEVTGVSVAE